jgi:hypothetical protein
LGAHAPAAGAIACLPSGPQTGTVVVKSLAAPGTPLNGTDGIYMKLSYAGEVPPVPESLSYTLSGPDGTRVLPDKYNDGYFEGVRVRPLTVGGYTVTAHWQVACDIPGETEAASSPPTSFTVLAKPGPSMHAQPHIDFLPYIGATSAATFADFACGDPNEFVAERLASEVFLTTNGSLPTRASRRYVGTAPRGCKSGITHFVKRQPAGGVAVTVKGTEVTLEMTFLSPVRVVRALFVVSSDGHLLGAMRVRLIHKGQHVALLADRGPCPVRCSPPEKPSVAPPPPTRRA